MDDEPVLDHLEHHGVKGMHWGTRRKVGPNGRVIGKSKPKASTDFKTTAPLRKRPSHTLTNLQLKKVNERMKLESSFHKMNPTRAMKGKNFVDNALKLGTGAAGLAGLVALAQKPALRNTVATGAKAVQGAAFRSSASGKMLARVGADAFTKPDPSFLTDIARGRFG